MALVDQTNQTNNTNNTNDEGAMGLQDIIKSVSSQTFLQISGKIVTSLSTIIILGAVSRAYGETGTGVFTLALAFLGFFYLLADFGINTHILPEILKNDFSLDWQKLLGMRLFFSLVLFMLAIMIALLWPGLDDSFRWSVIYGASAIFGTAVLVTCSVVFQSKLKLGLNVLATSAGALSTLILIFFLISLKLDVSYLMIGHMVGWLICGAFALILVRQFTTVIPLVDFSYIKKILQESWPISLTVILNLIYFRADAFILTYFKGFADVGLYNLAYSVFQAALVLPAFMMNAFYPLMLKDYSLNREKFTSNLLFMGVAMFGIAFLGTILTLLFSPWIIYLIGGGGFAGSNTSLQILSLSFPAFFISSILMYTLITLRKYKVMLGIYLTGLTVNIILNLILIPAFSYVGASIVTVASEYLIVILQLIALFSLRKSFQREPKSDKIS